MKNIKDVVAAIRAISKDYTVNAPRGRAGDSGTVIVSLSMGSRAKDYDYTYREIDAMLKKDEGIRHYNTVYVVDQPGVANHMAFYNFTFYNKH